MAIPALAGYAIIRNRIDSYTTEATLSAEELGAIAGTMSDPRQCGRCGFGPVDHSGCDSLSSHHGEVAVARGNGANLVSNACPRCGWFVPSLRTWPAWDGLASKTPIEWYAAETGGYVFTG